MRIDHSYAEATSCASAVIDFETPQILCIDDDPDVHLAIELLMSSYDVEFNRALFGMQGLAIARMKRIDLILLDFTMPSGDGEFLLEQLSGDIRTAKIPVIVLTGKRDDALRQRCCAAGAAAFLNKPIPIENLREQMAKFIALRHRNIEE